MSEHQATKCGLPDAHNAHDMPCDSGCQPEWHRDSCAIYERCSGTPAPEPTDPTPRADCDACADSGVVPWMHEGDPNCYQECDGDGNVPCPDCSPRADVGLSEADLTPGERGMILSGRVDGVPVGPIAAACHVFNRRLAARAKSAAKDLDY